MSLSRCNLSRLYPYVTCDDITTAKHALVTPRVDFCISLLAGLFHQEQFIQQAAACLSCCGLILTTLGSLHWLITIKGWINFKLVLMVLKALNGIALTAGDRASVGKHWLSQAYPVG